MEKHRPVSQAGLVSGADLLGQGEQTLHLGLLGGQGALECLVGVAHLAVGAHGLDRWVCVVLLKGLLEERGPRSEVSAGRGTWWCKGQWRAWVVHGSASPSAR